MELKNSFGKTKLDLETPNGGEQRLDTITTYPANNTGVPTDKANPGAALRYFQKFTPTETYLALTKTLPGKSNLLNLSGIDINPETPIPPYNIFDATNLDIEKEKVAGGIPYKQDKDPTVYPLTTQGNSSTNGFFPVNGQKADKFDQVFNPKNTYLNFIKKYT